MNDVAWQSDPANDGKDRQELATRILLSLEYREQGFRLSLVGSDPVVKAYNNLMQYFYNRENTDSADEHSVVEMMVLLGQFLLEIRRSMGNEDTRLQNLEMLEWFFSDARKMRAIQASYR